MYVQKQGVIRVWKYQDTVKEPEFPSTAGDTPLDGWNMSVTDPALTGTTGDDIPGRTSMSSFDIEIGDGTNTYEVCEELQEGWQYAYSCRGTCGEFEQITPTSISDTEVCIDVGPLTGVNPDYTVFFGNDPPANLTVIKTTNPASAPQVSFDFTLTGPEAQEQTFSLTGCEPGNTCGDPTPTDRTTLTVPAGSYTLEETGLPGNWDLTDVSCDIDTTPGESDASVVLELAPGADVTCTYTNERRPQIRIVKYSDLDASGSRDEGEPGVEGWQMFLYISDGQGGWTQIQPREVRTNAEGVANYTDLEPMTHLVCEEAREGWVNTDPGAELGAEIADRYCQTVENLVYGEIREVVFGNVETATIEVTVVAPGPVATFDFQTTNLTPTEFGLQNGQTQTFSGLLPGQEYRVDDLAPPLFWELVSVECSEDPPVCVTESITVTPEPGQTVTGTFTYRFVAPVPAEPKPIPTLSVYGLLTMVGLLGLIGAWNQRRRR